MYAEDMPPIADFGLANADNFADVVTFVLLTIQQPLAGVKTQLDDVRKRGAKSRYLFGAKRDGYRYVQDMKAPLFAKVKRAIETRDTAAGIDALLDVPSLGIVKAAFVLQLLGAPDAAVMDTHNLTRLGLKPTAFRFAKAAIKRPETRAKKIRDYLAYVASIGDAGYWWDSWCQYVVTKTRASGFANAHACSLAHPRALGLA